MRQHRVEQGLPPSPPAPAPQAPPPAAAPPTEQYKPRPHSAPHSLLVALLKSKEPLLEAELLRMAPPLRARPIVSNPPPPPQPWERPGGPMGPCRGAGGVLGGHTWVLSVPMGLGDPEELELRPGHFEVVLCADVTEGSG
ncbi:WAS/WASL-interacting protein family member 3-like, partial [Numida meleagris]|uniref:WAS/WASL-interacting protein family member 3-like n=1 Tax=Numida meleagris TaxID=8996 RepID=UPI000B3DF1DA